MTKIRYQKKKFKFFKKLVILSIFLILIYFIGSKIKLGNKNLKFLTNNYLKINYEEKKVFKEEEIKEELPLKKIEVYIYNTHPEELYSYQKLNNYNLDYNVVYASHMLQFYLEDEGIYSYVEEESVTNYLQENNLNYYDSYKASRNFLEKRTLNNPDFLLFIDIHRDAAPYEATTTIIDGKKYAKVLFILGLDNPNYLQNKEIITFLNDKLESFSPSITRGIMEKSGEGVDGVYNEDFNKNVFLIEIGGLYNYIDEVDNTLKVLAKYLKEYINHEKEMK